MRFSLFALLGLLALVFSASAATLDVEYDFSEPTLEGDDLLEENIDDATAPQEDEDDEGDDDEEEDQEEDLDEDDEPAPAAEDGNNKVDVHLYVPLPPGASLENEFPKWPFAGKDKDGAAKAGAAANKNEDFFDKSVGQFQSKVAAIVSRLKEEKEQLDAKDQKMDAHLAAIKAKIAKAQREIAELEKEDAANRAAGVDAAREKALRDKMRSHPILSKLYAARKFTIELKRMVRALKTMDPESPQYAETMGKIQSDLKQAKEDGTGITDIDDMVAVGASISFIEVDKVRDDEIAGLNGVLCAMMKHIQGEINKWEAKIRADHEAELAAAGGSHDERLRAARAALAEGQLALANYKAKMQREHMEIKAKLRQINAELTQLGAIDGHVSKYRRTRVATAEASSEQKAEGAAAPAAEEKPAWW